LHKKFQQLLHDYKRQAFKVEHGKQSAEQITQECTSIAEDVLKAKYNYHFHKLPDADRAEIINMINNYTREAILPPVVERIVQRQITLEKRVDQLVHLIEDMLENLSVDPMEAGKA
jgi:tRNA uridine 5-carbamoylmethylation protein Kti12